MDFKKYKDSKGREWVRYFIVEVNRSTTETAIRLMDDNKKTSFIYLSPLETAKLRPLANHYLFESNGVLKIVKSEDKDEYVLVPVDDPLEKVHKAILDISAPTSFVGRMVMKTLVPNELIVDSTDSNKPGYISYYLEGTQSDFDVLKERLSNYEVHGNYELVVTA